MTQKKKMKMNDKVISSRAEELLRFRIFIPAAFSFVCLLILTVVLFFEQVRSGEHHRQQVSRQSIYNRRLGIEGQSFLKKKPSVATFQSMDIKR